MKLYRVTTTVKEYHSCKNVAFHWFYAGERPVKRPYGELIDGWSSYGDPDHYAEGRIDELFDEGEAAQLKAYLDREHGREGVETIHGLERVTTIEEEELPMPNDRMGVGAIPVGGGDDFYMLDKEPGYDLPFEVWGYFSLVGCELVDGSDVYHHRITLVSFNSEGGVVEVRQQTNEEAAAMERAGAQHDDFPF